MQIDPLLSLLVGALGASLIALLGAWIQARRAHLTWLRQLRWEAYRDFLAWMDQAGLKTASPNGPRDKGEADAWSLELVEKLTPVSILGPRYVQARAGLLMQSVMSQEPGRAAKGEPRDKYLAAIKAALEVTWWPGRVRQWFLRRMKKRG